MSKNIYLRHLHMKCSYTIAIGGGGGWKYTVHSASGNLKSSLGSHLWGHYLWVVGEYFTVDKNYSYKYVSDLLN